MKDYVDYKKTNRIKLHFLINNDNSKSVNNYVIFSDDIIINYNDIKQTVTYNEITSLKLSICARVYNPSTAATNPISIFKKRAQAGQHMLSNKGPHVIYSLDMDIITATNELLLESYSLLNIKHILSLFNQDIIEDPLGILNLLKEMNSETELQKYLSRNFNDLAKKYHLDNPRGVVTNDMNID